MKHTIKSRAVSIAAFACTTLLAAVAAFSQMEPEVIYGEDDRRDLYQVKSERVRGLADSTAALFSAARVKPGAEGRMDLTTSAYGSERGLCKDEPFYDQRNGAFCSGSLVAPDLLMTAGHCVRSQAECEKTRFVFGFAIHKEGELPQSVPASDVYGCAQIIGRAEEPRGADWALVHLDRAVEGRKPLAVNRSDSIENGTRLFVIGHPAGLPTKVAGGASVRDASPPGHFTANLDTYGGNSGSAVFNAKTGLVEGILVRGETDYVYDPVKQCTRSKVCADDGCSGEDVTKVWHVAGQIPGPAARRLGRPIAGGALKTLLDLTGAGKSVE